MIHVPWSPRVGDSGMDRFELPGSERIGGGVSPGNESVCELGVGIFSNPPTLSEIAASSNVTQLSAYIQRQLILFVENKMLEPFLLPLIFPYYIQPETRFWHYDFADTVSGSGSLYLRQLTDLIRRKWGLVDFPWAWDLSDSDISLSEIVLTAPHFSEMRYALAPRGTLNLAQQGFIFSRASGWASNDIVTGLAANSVVGVTFTTLGGYFRRRHIEFYYVPEFLTDETDIEEARIEFSVGQINGSPGALEVWLLNDQTIPPTVADGVAFDTALGSLSPGGLGTFSVGVSPSLVVSRAGQIFKILITESSERSAGVMPTPTRNYVFSATLKIVVKD